MNRSSEPLVVPYEASGSDDDDDNRDEQSEENIGGEDSIAAEDRGRRKDEMPGEFIVLNQDLTFFEEVGRLGFHVIAQQPLGALGVTVTRLSIPAALSPAAAHHLLLDRQQWALPAPGFNVIAGP